LHHLDVELGLRREWVDFTVHGCVEVLKRSCELLAVGPVPQGQLKPCVLISAEAILGIEVIEVERNVTKGIAEHTRAGRAIDAEHRVRVKQGGLEALREVACHAIERACELDFHHLDALLVLGLIPLALAALYVTHFKRGFRFAVYLALVEFDAFSTFRACLIAYRERQASHGDACAVFAIQSVGTIGTILTVLAIFSICAILTVSTRWTGRRGRGEGDLLVSAHKHAFFLHEETGRLARRLTWCGIGRRGGARLLGLTGGQEGAQGEGK
tara:strand:+ start:883 stop:1692 length:810 start_codon:yes stop_codon:yes gene_type:complete